LKYYLDRRGTPLSTRLQATVKVSHSLLNVLLQTINRMGLQRKLFRLSLLISVQGLLAHPTANTRCNQLDSTVLPAASRHVSGRPPIGSSHTKPPLTPLHTALRYEAVPAFQAPTDGRSCSSLKGLHTLDSRSLLWTAQKTFTHWTQGHYFGPEDLHTLECLRAVSPHYEPHIDHIT
jgi:hypothetical protein